jgi:DNA-binding protein H-NS
MADLKELLEQRATIERQIAEAQRTARADAIAKVRTMMHEYGLTTADITAKAGGSTRGGAGRKVAAKYRNKSTGESWSGRGLQPKWLKAAINSGAKLTDFAV